MAELARLDALPLKALAAEVLTRGFGPTLEPRWTGHPGMSAVDIVVRTVLPGADKLTDPDGEMALNLVSEGVQVLKHAGLIRTPYLSNVGGRFFVLTRSGRAAVSAGTVAQLLG